MTGRRSLIHLHHQEHHMSDSIPAAYAPELGDWRLMKTGWVTGADGQQWDQPRALRGSTWHAPIGGSEFSFATPSAASLHLNAAWKSARRAQTIKENLAIHVFVNEAGHYSMQAAEESTASLFDYFEEMIGVAFGSFGAIEAYCNQLIIELAKAPVSMKRKKGAVVSLTPEEAERQISTDEKVKRLVPDLVGVPTPCGKAIWDTYLRIKHVRDAVTHFKRHDQMQHADKAHEPTVLLDLYGLDCFALPEDALAVLGYFQPVAKERWMMNPEWKRPPIGNTPPTP